MTKLVRQKSKRRTSGKRTDDVESLLREQAFALIRSAQEINSYLQEAFPTGPFLANQAPTTPRNISRFNYLMRMSNLASRQISSAVSIFLVLRAISQWREVVKDFRPVAKQVQAELSKRGRL